MLFSADQGINARLVQTLARHKHLRTIQRYIDVNENALRNAIELIEAYPIYLGSVTNHDL